MLTEEEIMKRIREGRRFMHMYDDRDPDYTTDQYLNKPQPPLFKEPVSDTIISLPRDFTALPVDSDFLHVINSRESHRVYTEEDMSLLELSWLLWCSQGVKDMRGKKYATLRTVPCGGARHEFELYMAVNHVEGLTRGFYHYLPQNHSIEMLSACEDLSDFIDDTMNGQTWACKSSVIFYFDMVAYRAEWRYGIYAHRIALVDAGYVSQNLYLACTSIGLGGCAIGSIREAKANAAFGLDGEEEFIFLAHPVGKISAKDKQKELDFYAFVHDYDDED